MHPIERLRYVARARGAGPTALGREAAGALAGFADDPPALVTACRRLVDRHPTDGPVWWLAARVLAANDPGSEAWRAAEELSDDPTVGQLAADLPSDATVLLVGWPEQVSEAVRRRGDLIALVGDAGGDGDELATRLARQGADALVVPDAGIAAAVREADLVLLEASALGPDGFVAGMGSGAAAAAAWVAQVPVWLVAGVGRALPGRMWQSLLERIDGDGLDPWDRTIEVVQRELVAKVVGVADPACPIAPELLRPIA
jgi:hypothetical protein